MAVKQPYGEMPHNLEAEQSLLACIIIDKEVHSILSKQTFYKVVEFDKKSILLEPATSIDRIEYAG